MLDHDQLFKELLQAFPAAFFELFFPEWGARFDFSRIEWLQQEMFPDPPDGERRAIDLVAKLPVRSSPGDLQPSDAAGEQQWIALIHIELESGTGIGAFRPRMLWYYVNIRQRHQLPVLPVALFQQVGLDGIGEDEYVESFGDLEVIRLRYLYVGFPKLDAETYLTLANPLAAGLVALMKIPEERQAEIKIEAARQIATASITPKQRHLLLCCLERYLTLSPSQESRFDRLLQAEGQAEVRTMAITTYEKGIEKGIEKGREQTLRQTVQILLDRRFPGTPETVRESLLDRSADELAALIPLLATAQTLNEIDV